MRLIFFAITFYTQIAFSVIEVSGVTGASDFTLPIMVSGTQQQGLIIFAGVAGQCFGDDPRDSQGRCNTCRGGPVSCNRRRIDPGGNLNITFRSTTTTGILTLANDDKNAIFSGGSGGTFNQQVQQGTLSIPWQTICSQGCLNNETIYLNLGIDSDGDGSLEDPGDDSLRFAVEVRGALPDLAIGNGKGGGIGGNEMGIYDFALLPGDEKAHILRQGDIQYVDSGDPDGDPFGIPPNFPLHVDGTTTFKYLRFYYEEGDCSNTVVGNNSRFKDVTIRTVNTDVFELSPTSLTGDFENGIPYVFKAALVDEAGNAGLFTDVCDDLWHVVTPDEVTGLFDPGFNGCFIATAAYGKYHSLLHVFYRFRDEKLLPYRLGRLIHDFYYTSSPPWAEKIQNNLFLRYMARLVLIPLWIYAFLTLQIGHIFTLFLMACFVTLMIYGLKKKMFLVFLRRANQ